MKQLVIVLFGKDGKVFGIYEGAYLLADKKIIYFLYGPKGETQQGSVLIVNDTLIHLAAISPGKSVKSYRSEVVLNDNRLYYYANYSEGHEFPLDVDYEAPLIYDKLIE